MELSDIVQRESYLHSLPMGPERWDGEIVLRGEKARCPHYANRSQTMPFSEWIAQLAEASKHRGVEWADDTIRAGYYEGQPDAWVDYYDGGDSPDDAITSDMECWD